MAQRNSQNNPAPRKALVSTPGIDEIRKKREEESVSIRKSSRNEALQKRRHLSSSQSTQSLFPNVNPQNTTQMDLALQQKIEELPILVGMITSGDEQKQYEATVQFRKLLSIERNPPIQQVIATGVVPMFVQLLHRVHNPILQFEAAWALTNVASGSSDQTRHVIDVGAVPVFIQLLGSSSEEVREQACWALGNIAGDSPMFRDSVLSCSILPPLLKLLSDQMAKVTLIRNATWTLSNLCRGKPAPRFDLVSPALPTLARLIHNQIADEEVLTDACWALSYLSDGSNDKIQAVLDTGIARRLVELLLHQSHLVQTPALRTIGNIVTGDDIQTQVMLNVGALPCIGNLLGSDKKGIKKEACWTISNITAGNKNQIQTVLDAGLFPKIIELMSNSEFDIRKEAAWGISNSTSGGNADQIRYLVERGCIKPLCDLLNQNDPRVINVALEGLENILKSGKETYESQGMKNPYVEIVEVAGGSEYMDQLQNHENRQIYEKVVGILEKYFHAEPIEADVLAPPAMQNQYSFGLQQPGQQPQQQQQQQQQQPGSQPFHFT